MNIDFQVMIPRQIVMFILLSAIISAALVIINMSLKDYLLMPQVVFDSEQQCIKVINFKNGDAFTCDDVDKNLRQYRKVIEK